MVWQPLDTSAEIEIPNLNKLVVVIFCAELFHFCAIRMFFIHFKIIWLMPLRFHRIAQKSAIGNSTDLCSFNDQKVVYTRIDESPYIFWTYICFLLLLLFWIDCGEHIQSNLYSTLRLLLRSIRFLCIKRFYVVFCEKLRFIAITIRK